MPGFEDGFFVGPTLIDQVQTEMDVYTEEIFGPVLSVVRSDSVDAAIDLINSNPYGNGTAIFTGSGEAARKFQRGCARRDDRHQRARSRCRWPTTPSAAGRTPSSETSTSTAPKGVSFYTRGKVITSRWPHVESAHGASMHFPTAS